MSVVEVSKRYEGVISLLRFLRRCNKLSEVDKFASAPDAETAIDILRNMMSTVYRNVVVRDGKKYCFEEEVKPDEKAVYEFLCGKDCVNEVGGRYVVRVECPKLPTEEELESLRKELEGGRLKPSTLAAMALARGRRP